MRKVQIGIIGSMLDVKLDKKVLKVADELGKEVAKNNAILLYGFEGDFNSLSYHAAKSAEKNGGLTISFNWGVPGNKATQNGPNSIVVQTGMWRGGGREFPFILSCDAVISIHGGAGTLTEIAMAYNADIPVVALENSGGWSSKLANTFIDSRKKLLIRSAETPQQAVALALSSIKI